MKITKRKKEHVVSELYTYETVVAQRGKDALLRKLAWILGYIFLFSTFIVWSATKGLSFPILTLGALVTGGAVLFTRKYMQVEYEYSVVGNSFYLSKIFGKRKRKAILEIDLKRARLIAPCTEEYRTQVEKMAPQRVVSATATKDTSHAWLILWDDEEADERMVLIFEANDKLLSILRRISPRALPREVKLTVNDRTVAQ